MTETPASKLFDMADFPEFLKVLGLDDIFSKASSESEDAPEDKPSEEENFYPMEEAVRILRKIEENVDEDPYTAQADLISVADRYIRLAEVGLQYGLDN